MNASSRLADFFSRLVVLTLVLAGVVAVFVWYFPLIQRNQNLRKDIAVQEVRIQDLQQEITGMHRRLKLFDGNSNTVERLIRENLGYGRPGEYIIRFEAGHPATGPATGR